MMSQNEMIEVLVQDFIKFSAPTEYEVRKLKLMLIGLELKDLELLVSQIKTEGV